MSEMPGYSLFERCGVELEYMIVDDASFDVRSLADELLRDAAGAYVNEHEMGDVTWSNELVTHVFELKVTEPVAKLDGVADRFQANIADINRRLSAWNARLMPGAAHPWMDPERDAKLWPHAYADIYRQFDAIFGCRTHGWTNLQSQHLNLPFNGDEEFGRLHAAIRLLLPLLPALAAASPYLDGRFTGLLDARLEAYRTNAQKIPSIAGKVIPEPVYTAEAYRREILERLYRETEPHDPGGILRYEWTNARGAIARFERNTIEIRVLDVQECPAADLSIAWAVVHVLRALTEERWGPLHEQQSFEVEPLRRTLLDCMRDAEETRIDDPVYLRALGYTAADGATAHDVWAHLLTSVVPDHSQYGAALETWLRHGSLAQRMLAFAGRAPTRDRLQALAVRLCDCLADGCSFLPGAP